MPNCNRDGCDDRAPVKLVGADGYAKAYRCRRHLKDALGLRDAHDGGDGVRDD